MASSAAAIMLKIKFAGLEDLLVVFKVELCCVDVVVEAALTVCAVIVPCQSWRSGDVIHPQLRLEGLGCR